MLKRVKLTPPRKPARWSKEVAKSRLRKKKKKPNPHCF